MLSERAKGKQRAVEEDESSRELVVRFTEGVPDLTITVNKAESVKNVKKRVRPFQFSLDLAYQSHTYLDSRRSSRLAQPPTSSHSFRSFAHRQNLLTQLPQ